MCERLQVAVPGAGIYVFNNDSVKWRVHQGEAIDFEKERVVFADSEENLVSLVVYFTMLGVAMQDYHIKNKSSLILPGI